MFSHYIRPFFTFLYIITLVFTLKNKQSRAQYIIVMLTVLAMLSSMSYANTVESFQEGTDVNTLEPKSKTSIDDVDAEKNGVEKNVVGVVETTSTKSENISTEPETNNVVDISAPNNMFDNTDVKDNFLELFNTDKNVMFYVSTFQKSKINKDKDMLMNHVSLKGDLPKDKNGLKVYNSIVNTLNQNSGLLINHKLPITGVYPRDINFNPSEFTIFWYAKFIPVKQKRTGTPNNVLFINIPIHNADSIISVEFEYEDAYVNPTIKINWSGKSFPNNTYKYRSTSDDNDLTKNFFDNQYHLFTLIKTSNNDIKLILDDQTLTSTPLIESKVNLEIPSDITKKNSYKFTLNANVNEPTPLSDSTSGKEANVSLNCYLNAFGIINRGIVLKEVNSINEYFKDLKYTLDTRYIKIKNDIKNIKEFAKCPFSDPKLCETNNCHMITDWTNNSTLLKNQKCFEDVLDYCNNLATYDNDKVCSFYDKNNILKSAAIINSSIESTVNEDIESEQEDLVKQLKKIGLQNIHLDKSLRANGKYSGEINELIDKIYEQKQLNLKGIEDLQNIDSEGVSLKKLEAIEPENKTESKEGSNSTMNMKYEDLDSYMTTMDEYDEVKSIQKKNEKPEEKSILSQLFG